MPQIINTNIASIKAQNNLNKSQNLGDSALQRLSSGLRINSAADDAAGLAIATRFQSQISGTQVAVRNSGDAISLAQTAEGALDSITKSLQRVRELALQSANDTNTDVDRQALQEEVDQLKSEIANVAEKTNFNGKKLLDGSFQNSQFQTGANVGDTISVSVSKLDTTTLGTAESGGISSTVDTSAIEVGVSDDNMAAGDLIINGISVGASVASTDTASTTAQSSSAIAKAAAINDVSDQTGVTAVVNENLVSGTNVTDSTTFADVSNKITINGTDFDLASSTSQSVEQNLNNFAATINSKSEATGVQATVVEQDGGFRIDLSAADGRNVTITGTAASVASSYGLATNTATTVSYAGSFTLVSDDGSDISLDTDTGNIDNAGFEVGTYSGANGGAVSDAQTAQTALVSGDVVINGVDIGATRSSDDTASVTGNDQSAIAIAAAVNRVADETGVSANVNANVVTSDAIDISAASSNSVEINGVTVNFDVTTDAATSQSNIVSAFNAVSGQTGVTAEAFGSDKFRLIAEDGRNIAIADGGTADNSALANISGSGTGLSNAQVNVSSISLESAGKFELSTNTGNISNAGLRVGTFGGAETGTKLKDIDVSTVSGANDAIKAVDNALQTVTSQRAQLGAVQNRFSNTISNLESLNENLNAAQSRIQDADFAAETARLAKSQVLQQAGISVLAQANARPQQALSLLQ
ncbi:flagellin [Marinobacteraceae bacterium S3BR75-40.1]